MNERKSVVLFGPTGQGKSSIANMLIQGDIHQGYNEFVIHNDMVGASAQTLCGTNEKIVVFDTIGIGEVTSETFENVSHKEAVSRIRDCFSTCQIPLNYICYITKKGRFTERDRRMFNIFKEVFKGGERNFIIIITNSEPRWVERNSETIKKYFGNHPIIPVDFPWINEDENDMIARFQRNLRVQSLQRLTDRFSNLGHHGIRLEVLSTSQKIENHVSKVVGFVPFAGSAYQLISSGVYYSKGKPNLAKERLIDGTTGAVLDVVGLKLIQSGRGVIKVAATKCLGKRIVNDVTNQKINQD